MYFTIEEAARILGMTEQGVRDHMDRGILKFHKKGRVKKALVDMKQMEKFKLETERYGAIPLPPAEV